MKSDEPAREKVTRAGTSADKPTAGQGGIAAQAARDAGRGVNIAADSNGGQPLE